MVYICWWVLIHHRRSGHTAASGFRRRVYTVSEQRLNSNVEPGKHDAIKTTKTKLITSQRNRAKEVTQGNFYFTIIISYVSKGKFGTRTEAALLSDTELAAERSLPFARRMKTAGKLRLNMLCALRYFLHLNIIVKYQTQRFKNNKLGFLEP